MPSVSCNFTNNVFINPLQKACNERVLGDENV